MNVAQVGGSIDGGGKLLLTAEEDKVVVVRWAWASVYQPNLEKGVALPQKFHDQMCKCALNNDTALFAGKCLSNLRYDDWRALNISEVLPSLNLLPSSLVDERPEDVSKFYTCLPEVEGLQVYKICVSKVHPPLQVPVLPSFPSSSEKLWVGKCVEAEK